jgi:hypothetical protein
MKYKKTLSIILTILVFHSVGFSCTEVINVHNVKAIYGRVFFTLDKSKEIIPNANVKIRRIIKHKDKENEYETIAEATTNKEGRFDFNNIPSGTYNILVETSFTKRFWGVVKLKSSSSKKARDKEILIYAGLPTNCDNYSELVKVAK